MKKNFTTGSVFESVILFSLPYLLSYFLQTLYGMADLFIIGQFEGVASTTAVSVGSQVMHMLTVIIVGLATAAGSLLSVPICLVAAVVIKRKQDFQKNKGHPEPKQPVFHRRSFQAVPHQRQQSAALRTHRIADARLHCAGFRLQILRNGTVRGAEHNPLSADAGNAAEHPRIP